MKRIPVEHSAGQTLCHDITRIGDDGFKGVLYKRGHVIAEDDIETLKNIGKFHVFVWEERADEIHEDDAAVKLARAAAGANITFSPPSEGKVTLISETDGLFNVKRSVLTDINMIPDITIACLPNNYTVKKGGKIAGARIIPLVTNHGNVLKAAALARGNAPLFEVTPFKKLAAGIIITGREVYEGRIKDLFEPVLRGKLDALGADILGSMKCPDDIGMIKSAIYDFKDKGAEIIILAGGMSVDPDDCTPGAIRESGAEVVTYGAPAQPGNMLMFARLDGMALFGVPSAAIHFKTTTLDVFMPRVFAGRALEKRDFAEIGAGGFCLGCAKCTYPICYFGKR